MYNVQYMYNIIHVVKVTYFLFLNERKQQKISLILSWDYTNDYTSGKNTWALLSISSVSKYKTFECKYFGEIMA